MLVVYNQAVQKKVDYRIIFCYKDRYVISSDFIPKCYLKDNNDIQSTKKRDILQKKLDNLAKMWLDICLFSHCLYV